MCKSSYARVCSGDALSDVAIINSSESDDEAHNSISLVQPLCFISIALVVIRGHVVVVVDAACVRFDPQFPKLRCLDLSWNWLERVHGLDGLKQLKELKIYRNRLVSCDGLKE